jgi:hypothetical protein
LLIFSRVHHVNRGQNLIFDGEEELYGSKDESNFNANGGFDVTFAQGSIKFTFDNDA